MDKLNLPKSRLSYSQMKLWMDDKEKYPDRYYLGIEERKTKELFFGSEVAKGLEDGTIKVPGLVMYPVSEWRFDGEVDGVPFAAYVDSYWPEKAKFREYKTGKQPWTQKKVNEHMQLDVYSTIIQIAEGRVDDECHLDWLVTRNKKKYMDFNGMQLEADSNDIEFTGEVVPFTRIITQVERDRMKYLIRSIANEITADYTYFLSHAPNVL